MQQEFNKMRIRSIYKMLFEMATGNFTYRIPRSAENDELESLVVLVNMMAEEMKTSAFHSSFINPHCTYQHLVHTVIVLNKDFTIKNFTSDTPGALRIPADQLSGMDFTNMLAPASQAEWLRIKDRIQNDPEFHTSLQLQYITTEELMVPVTCTISRLLPDDEILISAVTTVAQNNSGATKEEAVAAGTFRHEDMHRSDTRLIQQLHDYILGHLEAPLPSLKDLARMFGTNEFKIKSGFKYFFKTSIYQFYNDERLKRAEMLIQQTTTPLKHIAYMSGFSTYPNFSKAFKKRSGYAPNEVKRAPNTPPEEPEEDED